MAAHIRVNTHILFPEDKEFAAQQPVKNRKKTHPQPTKSQEGDRLKNLQQRIGQETTKRDKSKEGKRRVYWNF